MQMFSTKTREWFLSSVGTPTEAQRMGWQAISEGRDALISSPTGSGKTLAAFLYFLDEMRRELDAGALAEGLRIVYVSPLKALGNDICQNLERPLAGLGLSDAVRVAVRTGDTDAKARREMIKHPPHILITTPESLYLLLTSLSGRDMLENRAHGHRGRAGTRFCPPSGARICFCRSRGWTRCAAATCAAWGFPPR